jgi:hypothetical protein
VRRVKDEADRLGLRTKRSTTANGTREGIELLIHVSEGGQAAFWLRIPERDKSDVCWFTEFAGPYGRSRLWKNHSGSPRQQTTSITASWPTNTDALPANVSLREHGSGYLILPHGMRAEPITSKRGALGEGPSSVPMRSAPAVDPASGRGPVPRIASRGRCAAWR